MGKPTSESNIDRIRERNIFAKTVSAEFNTKNGDMEEFGLWKKLFSDEYESSGLKDLYDYPKKGDLPEHIQSFLHDIEQMDDLEKLQEIHKFTLSNMQYIEQNCYDELTGKGFFKETMMQGDCDDYALFEALLMRYAGMENTALFGGIIEYNDGQGKTGGGGHAVALTQVDGVLYMLDLNLASPVVMEDGKSVQMNRLSGEGSDTPSEQTVYTEVKRAMMFLEFGNNKKIYAWTHDDDRMAYHNSECDYSSGLSQEGNMSTDDVASDGALDIVAQKSGAATVRAF